MCSCGVLGSLTYGGYVGTLSRIFLVISTRPNLLSCLMMPYQLAENCRSQHDWQWVAPGLDFQSDSFYLFVDMGE